MDRGLIDSPATSAAKISAHCGPSASRISPLSINSPNRPESLSPASPDQSAARSLFSSAQMASITRPVRSAQSESGNLSVKDRPDLSRRTNAAPSGSVETAIRRARSRAASTLPSGSASRQAGGCRSSRCAMSCASRTASRLPISVSTRPPLSAINSSAFDAVVNASSESPKRLSGCFRREMTGTGSPGLRIASSASCVSPACGVADNGVPAESSASIPKRCSSVATRRASPRSGVISAA